MHTFKLFAFDMMSQSEFLIEQLSIVVFNPCLLQRSTTTLDD
jgi:hypothetical protein